MKSSYNGLAVPSDGTPIEYSGGELQVPDAPVIPFIEGDGTGRDIWKASRRVFDAAVEHAYGGEKRVISLSGAYHNSPIEGPALADLHGALDWLLPRKNSSRAL